VTMISMDKDSELIDSAAQDSLSQFAKRLKEFATKVEVHEDTASYWQLVFLQSKANGCSYRAENLPDSKWHWPKGTWFQEQRRHCLHAGKFAGHQ